MAEEAQPHREPFRTTVTRTTTIALVVGAVVAWRFGRLAMWPVAAVLALWLTFGGHYVELWYLRWLRPRLAPSPPARVASRLLVWFAGGVALGVGVAFTMRLLPLSRTMHRPSWWSVGVIFVVLELVTHAVLSLRGRPSFYDGAG